MWMTMGHSDVHVAVKLVVMVIVIMLSLTNGPYVISGNVLFRDIRKYCCWDTNGTRTS